MKTFLQDRDISFILDIMVVSTKLLFLETYQAAETPAVFLLLGVLAVEFSAKSRVWCRYVCPQAMLLIAMELLNPWRLRVVHEPERCVCRKEDHSCHSSCSLDLDPRHLRHPLERECNNCGDCYVTCQKLGRALRFRLGPGPPSDYFEGGSQGSRTPAPSLKLPPPTP